MAKNLDKQPDCIDEERKNDVMKKETIRFRMPDIPPDLAFVALFFDLPFQ